MIVLYKSSYNLKLHLSQDALSEGLIGEDLYLEKAAAEKIVESLEPGLHGRNDLGGERSAPFAVHPPLGRPGGLNVQRIEAGVADHPNAGLAVIRRHPFQGFARHLQQGGAEEPGNPVIPAGALQPGCQEILQRTAAGGVTIDHPLSPFQKSGGGNFRFTYKSSQSLLIE